VELKEYLGMINLSQYEKAVYIELVKFDISSANEIAKNSNVSHGRIYEVLTSLEKKGFVSVIPSNPKKYKAIEPEIALKNLLSTEEEKLNKLKKDINNLEIPPKALFKKQDYQDVVVISGSTKAYQIRNRMKENCKKEFLSMPQSFKPRMMSDALRERKVKKKIKQLVLIKEVTEENKKKIKKLLDLGVKIKKYNLKGFTMAIKDKEEVIVEISNLGSPLFLYSKNKDYANSMATFFYSLWDKAEEIKR